MLLAYPRAPRCPTEVSTADRPAVAPLPALGFRGVPPRARRDQHAADSPDPRNHLSSELSVGISCCSCRPLSHQRQHLCLRRRLGALSPLLVCASISASLRATGVDITAAAKVLPKLHALALLSDSIPAPLHRTRCCLRCCLRC